MLNDTSYMIFDTPTIPMGEFYREQTEGHADKQRLNPTASENAMCDILNNAGIEFEFQKVIDGKYIADFCISDKLLLEVDGSSHKGRASKHNDNIRNKLMKSRGYKTLRFWNSHLLKNKGLIITAIEDALIKIKKNKFNSRYIAMSKSGWLFLPEKLPYGKQKKKVRKWKDPKHAKNWKVKNIMLPAEKVTTWDSHRMSRAATARGSNKWHRQRKHDQYMAELRQKVRDNREEIIKNYKNHREERLLSVSRSNTLPDMEHLK